MTLPVYVNKGAFASGTGALTVGVPSGYTAGNLFLLVVESANQTVSTPSGWTTSASYTVGTGTAGSAGGVRVTVFYKWVTASEASVSVADSGNHTTAIILEYAGVSSSNPINAVTSGITSGTSPSFPALTTAHPDSLVVYCIANDRDAASTDNLSNWANANLTNLTERHDQVMNTLTGGGVAVADGGKSTAGDTGATTATHASTVGLAAVVLALTPAEYTWVYAPTTGAVTVVGGTPVRVGTLQLTPSAAALQVSGGPPQLGPNLRTSQIAVEVISQPVANLCTSQLAVEVLSARIRTLSPEGGVLVVSGGVPTLGSGIVELDPESGVVQAQGGVPALVTTFARVAQTVVEVVSRPYPDLQLAQTVVEVVSPRVRQLTPLPGQGSVVGGTPVRVEIIPLLPSGGVITVAGGSPELTQFVANTRIPLQLFVAT